MLVRTWSRRSSSACGMDVRQENAAATTYLHARIGMHVRRLTSSAFGYATRPAKRAHARGHSPDPPLDPFPGDGKTRAWVPTAACRTPVQPAAARRTTRAWLGRPRKPAAARHDRLAPHVPKSVHVRVCPQVAAAAERPPRALRLCPPAVAGRKPPRASGRALPTRQRVTCPWRSGRHNARCASSRRADVGGYGSALRGTLGYYFQNETKVKQCKIATCTMLSINKWWYITCNK